MAKLTDPAATNCARASSINLLSEALPSVITTVANGAKARRPEAADSISAAENLIAEAVLVPRPS